MASILLVEDNALIREALGGYLELDGHKVFQFDHAAGVLDLIRRSPVDLVILDIMLPDGNGFMLGKALREISAVPLIFLTAKDSESDRILGFEIGADDYVVKPFSSKELVLRVHALLKRYKVQNLEVPETHEWYRGSVRLQLDQKSHHVNIDGQEINLTGAEWKILVFLAEHEGMVMSRQQILYECLNYYFEGSEKTVITHMANLREKLGTAEWIETVRGFGYRFIGQSKKEKP